MRGLNRIAAFFAVTAVIAWAMVALSVAQSAQSSDISPPQAAAPPSSGSSSEPLSNRLDRSGGVIRPPNDIDRGLAKAPPEDGKTPVIPPPGTSANPGARPK